MTRSERRQGRRCRTETEVARCCRGSEDADGDGDGGDGGGPDVWLMMSAES